jgi:SWI/SNF-related matrix-associated actin-dependent regulator 1 of chromatin subfamily A
MTTKTTKTIKALETAIQHLAACCDHASTQDGQGFNQADAGLGHMLAEYPAADWSEEMTAEAAHRVTKYLKTQLSWMPQEDREAIAELGAESTGQTIKAMTKALKWRASRRCAQDASGKVFFWWQYKDPDFDAMKDALKHDLGARYSGESKSWALPCATAEDRDAILKVAASFGFTIKDTIKVINPRRAECPSVASKLILVSFPFDADIKDQIKAIPGRRWNSDSKDWEVIVTSAEVAEQLAQILQANDFDIHPKAQEVIDEALKPEPPQGPGPGSEPDKDHDALIMGYELSNGVTLYPFQKAGVKYLLSNQRALLTDEMGLGKTIQALTALQLKAAPGLVVCPAALKANWAREAALWAPKLQVRMVEARHVKANPEVIWPLPGELVITNFEALPEHPTQAPDGMVAIVDEAHALKKARADRTRRWRTLAFMIEQMGGSTWLMTGTPLVTSPADLWGVAVSAGVHHQLADNWPHFLKLWGGIRGRFGTEWGEAQPCSEALERLSQASLGRNRADMLDLPKKIKQTITVDVPAIYGSLDADLMRILRDIDDNDKPISPAIVARLAEARKNLATAKAKAYLPQIDDMIAEGHGPLVVFSAHKAAAQLIGDRKGWATITGDTPDAKVSEIVADFQAGKLSGVAGTIARMGTGLTLTASSKMVFIDLDWSPAINAQAEDRINRIGQENECLYIRLEADTDVDRIINSIIIKKRVWIAGVVHTRK